MRNGQPLEDTALLDAARALGPHVEACADQIEQDRSLPQPLVNAIVKAGLFKMLVPREMGGSEASPSTLVRVVEEVSRFDASVGWCVCLGAINGISSGCLPAHVAKEIFAQDEHACIAASVGPAPPTEDRPLHSDGGRRRLSRQR